ncbi:MAG: 2-amino-4-hydroxy-6-hydroxymethyldihydropteridine diphosphokinase, partial [Phycisphaeraceae bacterium]|nr:2-amino-4-hydroxy-6-hydroxymethyldihydropteridine diphosphokinase [Phycisphaeraceae bacterium]
MAHVLIALGSNRGDREARLEFALTAIGALPGTTVLTSSVPMETAPVGGVATGDFLNAAAILETKLEPMPLLEHLQAIEEEAGRPPVNERERWGDRELDLDILLY